MEAVVDFYGTDWKANDISAKCGWDITFTHEKRGDVVRVEVKGVSGD